jgi:hypothetical protein
MLALRRSTGLLAAFLALAFAFSSASPVVCATLHHHGPAHHDAAHHAAPAGHGAWTSPGQHGACNDMAHCGLAAVGPTLDRVGPLPEAPPTADRAPLAVVSAIDRPIAPAIPPPRV